MLACPNSFSRSYAPGFTPPVNFRTVVARENYQSFLRDATPLQRIEHLPHHVIGLHHEVAVLARLALPFELWSGLDRVVGRGEGHVEEERLAALDTTR